MVSIYALMSGQLVLYVGKSKRVKKREWEHRYKNGYCCSKQIPAYTDWVFKVLEETTEALGIEREQYFYDTLKPLYNHQRPGQTKKEYQQSENWKVSQKAYKQSEAGKASQKAYGKTEAGKAYRKAYQKTYQKTEVYKAYQKKYYESKKKLNSSTD